MRVLLWLSILVELQLIMKKRVKNEILFIGLPLFYRSFSEEIIYVLVDKELIW